MRDASPVATAPALLDTRVLVARSGRRRPLGGCTRQQLEAAHRLAVQDGRRMIRRDAPARLYGARVHEAALFVALLDELAKSQVPFVRLLPLEARLRAATRAGFMADEVLGDSE